MFGACLAIPPAKTRDSNAARFLAASLITGFDPAGEVSKISEDIKSSPLGTYAQPMGTHGWGCRFVQMWSFLCSSNGLLSVE